MFAFKVVVTFTNAATRRHATERGVASSRSAIVETSHPLRRTQTELPRSATSDGGALDG